MENHKELPNRIKDLLAYLNGMLSGKEEAIRLTLLSAIAGEHIFLSGPSALDKKTLVRCVTRAFPYSNEDAHHLYTDYGPSSYSIYFINSDISNKDISEVFWDSMKRPGTFLAVASQKIQPFNLEDKVLEEYIALHVQVNTASNDEAFFKFVENPDDYIRPTQEMFQTLLIDNDDIKNWRKEIDKVELSDDAKNLISEIRRESFEYFVSDFRWRKIVHVLKTCAFLNGRTKVDLVDCSLIDYAIPGNTVEGILKQKLIDGKLNSRQHSQYKENIFARHKYYQILKSSVDDKKLKLDQKTENLY